MNEVPCKLCRLPTTKLGTQLCDPCWELDRRLSTIEHIRLMCRNPQGRKYLEDFTKTIGAITHDIDTREAAISQIPLNLSETHDSEQDL